MLKRLGTVATVVAATVLVAVGPTSSALADVHIMGGCGYVADPKTTGGEAHWTITCGRDFAIIDGWVKDTKADGKCAYVKAFNDGTGAQLLPHPKACPEGTKKSFNWSAELTQSISAYLYVM